MRLLIVLICFTPFTLNFQEKGPALLKEGYALYAKGSYDSALRVIDEIFSNEDFSQDRLLVGNAHYTRAIIYKSISEPTKALVELEFAKSIATDLKALILLANGLQLEGQVYKSQGRLEKALSVYDQSKEIYLNSHKPLMAGVILTEIGNIEMELERHDRALPGHLESLVSYRAAGDSNYIALGTSNLAHAQAKLRLFEEALPNFYQAISLKKKHSTEASLGYTYQYLGEAYLNVPEPDSARKYLTLASTIKHKFSDVQGMAETANLLANLEMLKNRFPRARPYLDSAYAWANRAESRSLIIKNLELQRDWYKGMRLFEKALEIDARYDVLRDSLFQDEKLKVQELQASFDLNLANDRAEQAEQQRAAEERNARTNLILAVSLGLFLLTTLFFLSTVYRQRKKLDGLNQVLEEQNQKIQTLNRQNFHFTKNSLTEVVGLINMQANKLEDGVVKHSLVAERLRIETVNLLYRQLFADSADTETKGINMHKFLSGIVTNTFDSLIPIDKEVALDLNIDKLLLPNEMALGIGLITNEICINACKYAFKDQNTSRFTAGLLREENVLVLHLGDNGKGLAPGVEFESSQSFGMQLIRLLAQDLRAEVSLDSSESGLSYYFRIPFDV